MERIHQAYEYFSKDIFDQVGFWSWPADLLSKVSSSFPIDSYEQADSLLIALVILFLSLFLIPVLHGIFSRESPVVPRKSLPLRPVLKILFAPDEAAFQQQQLAKQDADKNGPTEKLEAGSKSPWRRRISSFNGDMMKSVTSSLFSTKKKTLADDTDNDNSEKHELEGDGLDGEEADDLILEPPVASINVETVYDSDDDDDSFEQPFQPFVLNTDLPDSFAPLLSSSHVEIANSNLTADLIHAVSADASVRLRHGRHEIPLNKDASRPQFVLDVPEGGCKISVAAVIGSDGFDIKQDLDPLIATTDRSKPLVKQACVTLDPPLPLANVAPTLIHFPSLFVDKLVVRLRKIYIFRFFIDFVVSISSFLERCLWLIEARCQIHLSKAQMVPQYKGFAGSSPKWHLCPAFSGHVLIFGWIPIPFIGVVLPSFIIPHPHALLDSLVSMQPFASAKLKRENIAEERIVIAALDPVEKWTAELKLLATPPAASVDVTLPGGLSVAVDMNLGRDPTARSHHVSSEPQQSAPTLPSRRVLRSNSLSSWSTTQQSDAIGAPPPKTSGSARTSASLKYDANKQIPWLVDFKAKGSCSREKLAFHLLNFDISQRSSAEKVVNEPVKDDGTVDVATNDIESSFSTSGSLAIWKVESSKAASLLSETGPVTPGRSSSWPLANKRATLSTNRPALESSDSCSVAAILLFPEETTTLHHHLRMLQYDYALEVSPNSKLDSLTLSVGATHPMLKGGTTMTAILDSIYAFGSTTARDDAVLDPMERKRKRNILRHLPAIDFTCGVNHIFIPSESRSYSDDGQTLVLPELDGGRLMLRFLGGIDKSKVDHEDAVSEGVVVVGDFEVASLNLKTEGVVKEFPELEIYEGTKLRTNIASTVSGRIKSHLRPQKMTSQVATAGPNIFNPLEAYEIDFSSTSLSVKMREYSAMLGHRRIILPAESCFVISIIESVVDMGFEGKTLCELSWDFQGLSPILQVVPVGESPADAPPESKEQVSILIGPLRQGRLSLSVSAVGGIQIQKAATSRDHREGLYDWKFFNAIVSPDESSAKRIIDVLHDQRTMNKLLQVVKLISEDLHKIMQYILNQVWRAKEILDSEGVSDPGHAIPMYKMARLMSMFLTGDIHEVSRILPLVRRVIEGDGLDVVTLKELLRNHLPHYDDWAPEIDRALRWASIAVGPMAVSPNVASELVTPLAELPRHRHRFINIPTAAQLYSTIMEKRQLPLDPAFSALVGRVAPYLSFRQIEFILESRTPTDWQQADLRRLRYVYSIKKKVLEIAESYGGFSFLPQSFLVSVFLGEATKSSLRVAKMKLRKSSDTISTAGSRSRSLRSRRQFSWEKRNTDENFLMSPAQAASMRDAQTISSSFPEEVYSGYENQSGDEATEPYELGDSLLGPQDVAILLQSGLTSVMKSSTVVQLNQRMLLDLICSQPKSFAVAVLAEIGTPSGEGSPRSLTSALMSLLELDQTAFTDRSQIDMHALLESWLQGQRVPRRKDYMAGGRWARQSYYEAIFAVATSILEDAEVYMALKGRLQRVRHEEETDPVPGPIGTANECGMVKYNFPAEGQTKRYAEAVQDAVSKIAAADVNGHEIYDSLVNDALSTKASDAYSKSVQSYHDAFAACARLLELDRYVFQLPWFADFYKRNYDALMIKSIYDNLMGDVDSVRHWLQALRNGSQANVDIGIAPQESDTNEVANIINESESSEDGEDWEELDAPIGGDGLFMAPEGKGEQVLLEAIIDAVIYNDADKEKLCKDPLVRLLIPNPAGVHYNFAIVSAMGVITEGEDGLELKDAFERLERERGVIAVRAGTGTARSLEYNAGKIEQAITHVTKMGKPYGLLGYSQGCANALTAETLMNSGSPKQRSMLKGLLCRQLVFSAANGSVHGPSMERKIQRLIVLCEEFFKYQQGYVSHALASAVVGVVTNVLDSSDFHKFMGGAQSFLPDGCRAFWREAQHLGHIPTCTLRGVLEKHTTPESLEMISNLLTKQSGSALHDSQVHAFDAVGHPVYHRNRNGRIMERCDIGEGCIQRTHHWSPLSDEVEFVRTKRDIENGAFECAKDRHVAPWVEVNARFGFIKPLLENKHSDENADCQCEECGTE